MRAVLRSAAADRQSKTEKTKITAKVRFMVVTLIRIDLGLCIRHRDAPSNARPATAKWEKGQAESLPKEAKEELAADAIKEGRRSSLSHHDQ